MISFSLEMATFEDQGGQKRKRSPKSSGREDIRQTRPALSQDSYSTNEGHSGQASYGSEDDGSKPVPYGDQRSRKIHRDDPRYRSRHRFIKDTLIESSANHLTRTFEGLSRDDATRYGKPRIQTLEMAY